MPDDDLFSAATDPLETAKHVRAGTSGTAAPGAGGRPGYVPPLAVRMRPAGVEEVVGQRRALAPGSPLQRLLDPAVDSSTSPASVILWGPPGTGKTTLAYLVALTGGREFVEVSAVSGGVKEIRAVVEQSRRTLAMYGRETVLFIDEVHRFSTAQQDALLPSVENRWVTLVAATTENPYHSVNSPLLSRSLVVTLESLERDDLVELVRRALADPRGLGGKVGLSDEALAHLLRIGGGDARKTLTALESGASAALQAGGAEITEEILAASVDQAALRYDKAGDQHYDVTSAFIKSMRGSDPDAALHYLARMIASGEDPRFIARRIVIAASEDVGMADPSALQTAVSAMQAVAMIGMPEARIILGQAVVHVATAPKSNASYNAINSAIADVEAGRGTTVPAHLRDAHYRGAKDLGHGTGYLYAHDAPHSVARQQYPPDDLVGVDYYRPTANGVEKDLGRRLEMLRRLVRGEQPHSGPGDQAPPEG
jgi:putative ATPase